MPISLFAIGFLFQVAVPQVVAPSASEGAAFEGAVSLIQLRAEKLQRSLVHHGSHIRSSVAVLDCAWSDSTARSGHTHQIGFAESEDECLALVLDTMNCPLASSADFHSSTGACHCVFHGPAPAAASMISVRRAIGWRSCALAGTKTFKDDIDCNEGWQLGVGVGSNGDQGVLRRLVGFKPNRKECILAVKEKCPTASGATIPSHSSGDCFCEFRSALADDPSSQTCFFGELPLLQQHPALSDKVSSQECGSIERPLINAAPPPVLTCSRDLALHQLSLNNFGGPGHSADGDGRTFLFRNALAYECGRTVDLKVTMMSAVMGGDSLDIGVVGQHGRATLNEGSTIDLAFSFLDSQDGAPVFVDQFLFSILNLNQDAGCKGRSKLAAKGFDAYYLSPDTSLQVFPDTPDGSVAFLSSSQMGADEQVGSATRAVTFLFSGRSTFELQLAVGAGSSSRDFLFGSPPPHVCAAHVAPVPSPTAAVAPWQKGRGDACHQHLAGQAQSESECADLVRNGCPLANGASLDGNTGSCFCEFRMTGQSLPTPGWASSLLAASVASGGWHLGGGNGVGMNGLSSRKLLFQATDRDACATRAAAECAGATGASMPSSGTGACYCEFGPSRDQRADFQSALFS